MKKICPGCGRDLEPREFHFKKRSSGLRQVDCRECSREYVRDHDARNREYYVRKAVLRNRIRWRELLDRIS